MHLLVRCDTDRQAIFSRCWFDKCPWSYKFKIMNEFVVDSVSAETCITNLKQQQAVTDGKFHSKEAHSLGRQYTFREKVL